MRQKIDYREQITVESSNYLKKYRHIILFLCCIMPGVQQAIGCLYYPTTIGAYYSGTLEHGCVITFTGASSHGKGDLPYYTTPRWEWDFDYNGTFTLDVSTTSPYPTWTYSTPRTYTVAVKYYDCKGWGGNVYTFQIVIKGLKRYYYVKDHLGSIRVTVDQAGIMVGYNDYDAWGVQMETRCGNYGSANDKYKFTGKERDGETGLDYFGARYYDARIGLFRSVDPHTSRYPNLGPYTYCGNNPIAFMDPSGKDSAQAQQLNKVLKETHENYEGSETPVCNVSTVDAVKDFLEIQGAPMPAELVDKDGNPVKANEVITNMEHSSNFQKVSVDEAEQQAANGAVVIAGWKNPNPDKSGHIDVVGAGTGYKGGFYGSHNLIMIGNSIFALKDSWEKRGNVASSFGKNASPTYFLYKGFTHRPNSSNIR